MGAPFSSVSEAQDRVNDLVVYEQDLGAEIAHLREEMASVHDMKEATLRWIRSKRAASSKNNQWPVTLEEVRHCRTQRAVLREWALTNNSYARITDVAEFIMQTDLPNGTKDSVRASLTNFVKESDQWQYDSPGVYRLLEAIQPSEDGDVVPHPENEPASDAEPVVSQSSLPVIPGDLPAPFTVFGEGGKQCA